RRQRRPRSAAPSARAIAAPGQGSPPRATHLPKATVLKLTGLGSSALVALQVPSAGGDKTNLLTVLVRDRNVLITVVSQGPARARGGYRPLSPPPPPAAAVAAVPDGPAP